jgi:hypothetical protein
LTSFATAAERSSNRLRFRYLYVGLPGLDALEYLEGPSWLGVALAALMKIPADRVAWLAAEALKRIAEAPLPDRQRFLLGECVQAYLPMDEEQKRKFRELIVSPRYQGVKAMNVTWFEEGVIKGRAEGLEIGKEEGLRTALRDQLEERFGPLSPQVLERLEQVPAERLRQMTRAVWRVTSLKDLGLLE